MLVDHAQITVKAGNGGRGCFKTRFKRPIGGDGGKGGDIYIEGSTHVADLGQFRGMTYFEAESGNSGQQDGKQGRFGKDFTILVPFGTTITINDTVIATITRDEPRYQVSKGKKGALGNESLKRLQRERPISEADLIAEEVTLQLDFALTADVLFIGYPNAGKSSMLNQLTRAHAKVAPYAFTTVEPQLGRLEQLILMDLPGLIDGTHSGKGLGTGFLKHTRQSRLIAHFVSLEADSPNTQYLQLRAELSQIDKELSDKPEIVILTKSDEATPEKIKAVLADFKKLRISPIVCSILDDSSIQTVREALLLQAQIE